MDTKIDTGTPPLTIKDFASDQEVRWCPGCGDYSVIKAVQKTLVEVGARKENTVFVSGIGCSSRFPYYMDTYGFHGIHGRAPAIASGLLLANPDLDVWVVTGDGDGLSIGGNHMIHILRHNYNCVILLFNNGVYGLTKGQYSPTSEKGQITPSSPFGVIDPPLEPAQFAIGAGARFVARVVDIQQQQMIDVLKAAYEHKGAALVEIFQNCTVFNEGMCESFASKSTKSEHQIELVEGQPLVYGKDHEKGLKCDPGKLNLKSYDIGGEEDDGHCGIVHDPTNRTLAFLLAQMQMPDYPMATGVIYNDPAPSYEREVMRQIDEIRVSSKRKSMSDVLHQGFTWKV
jgi:2-oxoglutarate ferredoxin oxidoreductase subunit beta